MDRIMRLHELGVTCRATESDSFCPQTNVAASEALQADIAAVAWQAGVLTALLDAEMVGD
jgi:hypothetical protein